MLGLGCCPDRGSGESRERKSFLSDEADWKAGSGWKVTLARAERSRHSVMAQRVAAGNCSLATSCGPSPATSRRPWPSTSSSLPMHPRSPPCGSGPTRSSVGHHSPPPAPWGVLVLDPGSGPHRSRRRLCTLVPRLRLRLRISAGSMENREGGGSSSLVRKPCTIERSSRLSPNPCSCVAEQGTHIRSILNQSASRYRQRSFQ